MARDRNSDRRNGRRSDSRGGSMRRRGSDCGRRGRDSRDGAGRDRRGYNAGHVAYSNNYVRRDCSRRGGRSGSRRRGQSQRSRTGHRRRSRSHSQKNRRRSVSRSQNLRTHQVAMGKRGGGSSSSSSAPKTKKKPVDACDSDASFSGTDEDEIIHFDWKPDMVLNSRYRLLKLCGDGTFGRVVLAHDSRTNQEVAIKIIRDVPRYMENAQIEADILMDIRKADPEGKSGCAIMYEYFVHSSKFFSMVFEPLGTSLYDFLKDNDYRGYWMQDIQAFARQCMEALAFLHSTLRMTHTDLKPENVLLYSQKPPRESAFPREAEWMKANKQPSGFTMKPYMRPVSNAIKIIDFGNATYEHEQHSSIINTRQYRGPEVLLACGWNELSDQWSIGCILMELYSGNQLFETHEELEHLALMEQILGQLPASVVDRGAKSLRDKWFKNGSGGFRLAWPENASSSASVKHVASQRHLQKQLPSIHAGLSDFCAELLELDPRRRKSADAMLRHSFLARANTYED